MTASNATEAGAAYIVNTAEFDAVRTATVAEFPSVKQIIQVDSDSEVGKLLSFFGQGAITINQTIMTTKDISDINDFDNWLLLHEIEHTVQQLGVESFNEFYLAFQMEYGYQNNPYEIGARTYADVMNDVITPTLVPTSGDWTRK